MKKTLLSPPSNFSNTFLKFLVITFIGLASTFTSNAQVSGYAYSETTGATYTAITGGTVVVDNTGAAFTTIASFATYTLPFTFYYNNIGYTAVSISDNGFITLGNVGTAVAANTTPISGATTNDSAISCYGMNLASGTIIPGTSEIRYEVTGTSPNRVFVVQYKDMQRRPSLSTLAGVMNMQIRLSETTGLIEMIYGNGSAFSTANTTVCSGQVGLRGTSTADFSSRKTISSTWVTSGSTPSTADVMQTSNTIGYAAGTKLTWTPCSQPSSITAVLAGDNSTLNVGWTSPNVVPTVGFDYEIRTGGTAGGSGASGLFASGNSSSSTVSVPGLAIGTPYCVFVKSNCRSVWITGPCITPACSIASIPYSQTFEGVTVTANTTDSPAPNNTQVNIVPACNTNYTGSGAAVGTTNNSTLAYYGFNNKNLITTGALAQNAWFFTQAINIPSSGDYKLTYKYGGTREQSYFQQKMKVYYGSTPSVAGMTVLLADHDNIKTSPNTNAINFTVVTPGTYYIGFYGYANASQGYLQLDDITLDHSTCIAPTLLTSGQVASSTALISWTAPASSPSGGYDYYVSPITGSTLTAGSFSVNSYYRILSVGTTSFTSIGASANTIGTIFQATGIGAGTGTAQLITTVAATTISAGGVYQVISVGTTNYTTIGGVNTVGSIFQSTGTVAGTGLVVLVSAPVSSITPTGSTAAGGVIANLSGLTPSTGYYFWVRSNCGSPDISSWAIPNTFTTTVLLTYCTPSGGGNSQDPNGITNVTMGSINNTTGIEANNYGDYTYLSTNVAQTTTVPVSITFRTGFTYYTDIWVDWNNDGDFNDTGELVYTGESAQPNPSTLSASFVVPTLDSNSASTIGPHRLRIGGIDDPVFTGGALTPCRNGAYQTFEDYSIYVTVAPPALTLDDGFGGTSNTICEGDGNPTITVSSNHSDFQVYTWTPSTGVSGSLAAGYTLTPTITTTYILTATQTSGNFSSNSASYTITVNPLPTPITIAPAAPTFCQNDINALVASGGIVSGVTIMEEDFNGATNSFTATNNSTGGTVANSAWMIHASPYTYGQTFSSNDTSQFIMSNSDNQGSTGTTNTILESPVFSLVGYTDATLSFWHYYRGWGSGTATVEVSTDGGGSYTVLPSNSWTTVTQGASNGFVNVILSLASYATVGNANSNMKIRFKYTNAIYGWYWAIDNVKVYGSASSAITWSPTSGLYINSTATTPYTGAMTTSTVYVKKTSSGSFTYTASADSPEGCTTSTDVTVTILPIVAGTTSANQTLSCGSAPGDITLTGYTGTITGWQYSTSSTFASGIVDIASTASATLLGTTIGNINQTLYYRAVVTNGICTSYSNICSVIVTTTNWVSPGTWSNGVPNSTSAVDFQYAYPAGTGNVSACSVVVSNGAVVGFGAGETLTVQGTVTVNAGCSLSFANSASLYQVLDVVNAVGTYNGNGGVVSTSTGNQGNISYSRTTPGIRYNDYTYWSSPTYTFTLNSLSPLSPYLGNYYYNNVTQAWNWISPTTTMTPARGYIVRAPETYSLTVPAAYTATFTGKPNSGTIPIAVTSGALNLIGNPYPSALDAYKFLTDASNSGAGGTLYFWTHNTDMTAGVYTNNDYATYNISGGVGVGAVANTGGALPNGNIGSGEAFFINGFTSTSVSFKNSMRMAGNNSQFFKTGNQNQDVSSASGLERNRYWLDIQNEEGAFKEALVAYVETATMGLDRLFDGEMVDVGNVITMYTKVDDTKLTIQGRSLPFDVNDLVPLAYKSTIAGNYTITMPLYDGLFTEQHVYLEDTVLNVIHDLRDSAYTFTTEAGTFEDRFVLRYTNSTLGITNPSFDENTIVVYHNAQGLHINSGIVNMNTVTIFDIRGRQIASQNGIDNTETAFTNLPETHQVLLVKIEGVNGKTVTKKVVY